MTPIPAEPAITVVLVVFPHFLPFLLLFLFFLYVFFFFSFSLKEAGSTKEDDDTDEKARDTNVRKVLEEEKGTS